MTNSPAIPAILASILAAGVFSGCAGSGAPPPPAVRFGFVSDVQYCDCDPHQDRYYRDSPARLEAAVSAMNGEELDFVIQIGDMIDRGLGSFGRVLPILEKVKAPLYHVLGNHDFSVDSIYRDSIRVLFGAQRGFYDFGKNCWRFVVLDGNDLSWHGLRNPSAAGERDSLFRKVEASGSPQAVKWNGGLGREQMAWFRETLMNAAEKGEQVIVFCHYPVYPPDRHNLWNDSAVVAEMESAGGVRAYINGHKHDGGHTLKRGIHYLDLEAMVQTEGKTAFGTAALYPEKILIKGAGREKSRELKAVPAGRLVQPEEKSKHQE